MVDFPVPLMGFAAWSGTGKTTLLSKLIPILAEKGLRTGLVKHAHHCFDMDFPGKDSYVLREAGAAEVVVASRHRIANIVETRSSEQEPSLEDALASAHADRLDLILVEGFKAAAIPKIELHRQALNKPYLYPNDTNIIAIAEDSPNSDLARNITQLDLNQPARIAEFIESWMAP